MLDILLSHWAVYGYIVYVLIVAILSLTYRPHGNTFHGKQRPFRPHMWGLRPRTGIQESLR